MPEQSPLRPAIFLDRDSTFAEELGCLNHASRFRMFPFVAEDLLQAADWVLRQQK